MLHEKRVMLNRSLLANGEASLEGAAFDDEPWTHTRVLCINSFVGAGHSNDSRPDIARFLCVTFVEVYNATL